MVESGGAVEGWLLCGGVTVLILWDDGRGERRGRGGYYKRFERTGEARKAWWWSWRRRKGRIRGIGFMVLWLSDWC